MRSKKAFYLVLLIIIFAYLITLFREYAITTARVRKINYYIKNAEKYLESAWLKYDVVKEKKAIRELKKAQKLDEECINCKLILGFIYAVNSQEDETKKIIKELTKLRLTSSQKEELIEIRSVAEKMVNFLEWGKEELTFYLKQDYILRRILGRINYFKLCRYIENALDAESKNEWEEAETEYKKALSVYPKYEIAYIALGDLKKKQNKLKLAKNYYKRGLKLIPYSVNLRMSLALVYKELEDVNNALKNYLLLLKADLSPEKEEEVRFQIDSINNNFPKDALKFYSHYLKKHPLDKTETYYYLGEVNLILKDYDKAKNYYEKVIEFNPEAVWPYLGLVRLNLVKKDFKKVRQILLCLEKFNLSSLQYWYWSYYQKQVKKEEEIFKLAKEKGIDIPIPSIPGEEVKMVEKKINNTTIKLVMGDITDLQVDAIVNAANNHLWMGAGVAGAIKKKGGKTIEEEAVKKGPIAVGEVVETTAGNLKAKYVIHAAVMGQDLKTDENIIRRATINTLKKAQDLYLKSIALPALGTGVGGFPVDVCAKIMLEETVKFTQQKSSLNLIIFALFGNKTYNAFVRQLEVIE